MLGAFGKSQVCDFSNENVCISERAYATHTLTYVCKFASIAVQNQMDDERNEKNNCDI